MRRVTVNPPRQEQELIKSIVQGKEGGRYFLILGSKVRARRGRSHTRTQRLTSLLQGAGKASMVIEEMEAVQADGCAFFEAHSDISIVVDRFSEAINL
jgi:hypothetical protein